MLPCLSTSQRFGYENPGKQVSIRGWGGMGWLPGELVTDGETVLGRVMSTLSKTIMIS
jgi:hypothetical protein